MKIYLFLCLALLGGHGLYSQSIEFKIEEQNGQPIQGALVISYLGLEYGPSDSNGWVKVPESAGSQVQIFKEGYFIKLIELDWNDIEDGSQQKIILQKNDIQLLTAEVSAEKLPFTDTLRVRDFALQDSLILVLGYRYLVLANLRMDVLLYLPNELGFQSIESDPRGNLFLMLNDSVVQVYLNKEMLYFYPAVGRPQYRQYIEPLVAVSQGRLILRNNRIESMPLPISPYRAGDQGKAMTYPLYHNQGVQMFIFEEGQAPREFYHSVDTQAVIYAHDAFMDAFNIAARMERLFDEYGVWNHPKLIELAEYQKIYRNAFSKYRPTQVFPYQNGFVLFDHFVDKVRHLDAKGALLWEEDFLIDDDFINPIIIQDLLSQDLFALRRKRGMVYLHPIQDFKMKAGIKVDLFAKETKLRGNRLFYINESNYLKHQILGEL